MPRPFPSTQTPPGHTLLHGAATGLILLLLTSGCASTNLSDLIAGARPLDQETVASGLREALTVGTGRAADRLSTTDAFAGVASRRIGLPDELDGVARRLRQIGLDEQVSNFELRMNRAAEAAIPGAVSIFSEAARTMTIQDAFSILNGPPDAATSFFEERTRTALLDAFGPEVNRVMMETGVYQVYTELSGRYNALPIANAPAVDLTAYVTEKATTALFEELAVEEARIRQDPAARTTALLQRVFASR
ncbi:MAG: hypothetical protein COV99_05795 [Bacteroidetes bacterium CG12_big_fil_rev_8_21_14_0_65_60_17]|nr:MAG: hypothetical protein COV99_05795 [Bacteroidetes bacterium CG12_big_fil_rev_8_21_14_0_65_60_17]